MKYKAGYKYQLAENFQMTTEFTGKTIKQGFISLTVGGVLTLSKGYAWDGPSGPAIDTKNFMRGSLVHDALYQLMRKKRLDPKIYREPADRFLQTMCVEDGMWKVRAWWVYKFVSMFAKSAADPKNERRILTAP
jgi:hypothetical protein